MAAVAEALYRERHGATADDASTASPSTRHGYGEPAGLIPVVEAGHPVPDAAGRRRDRARRSRSPTARGRTTSSWCCCPAAARPTGSRRRAAHPRREAGHHPRAAALGRRRSARSTRVRKHLSRIKGGRLARAAAPAPRADARHLRRAARRPGGDRLRPDRARPVDARRCARRRRPARPRPAAVRRARLLDDPGKRDAEARRSAVRAHRFRIVARPADAIAAAARARCGGRLRAGRARRRPRGRGARGRSRACPARAATSRASGRRAAILSGGELTVTMRGRGRGGPNQEYALALAIALEGAAGIAALAADTDGTDGGGGSADRPGRRDRRRDHPCARRRLGLDAPASLLDNDSTNFFERLGDLVTPGPTRTNVNDCRIILRCG